MRDDYVKIVKEYLNTRPDYKNTLKEIKANLLTTGVTEEEFEEALKQVGMPLAVSDQKINEPLPKTSPETGKTKPQTNFSSRLLKFDVAANLVVLLIIIIAAVVFFVGPLLTPKEEQTQSSTNRTKQNIVLPEQLVKQVYANDKEVDPTEIFSYKPVQVSLYTTGRPKKEVYGFFPYWMLSEHEKVSLNALTTIGLFALETDGAGNIITARNGSQDEGWAMWNNSEIDVFIKRAKARRIKIELVVKAFDSTNIERLVISDKAQQLFISNVIQAVQSKSLNGVNLDFEYVGTPSQTTTDDFTRLVTNLQTELKRQLPNATLTISSYVNAAAVPKLVDVEALAGFVDAFIIMGYDIHTPAGSPGPIAPIEGNIGITGYLQSYLEKSPPEKLILAVPYYGYDWPVPNVNGETDVKILPYAEIAEASKNSTILWDDTSQSPYYKYVDPDTNSAREVHFENTRSLGVKYDFVNRKELRGIAIWALGYEGLNSDLRALILEKF